MLEDGAVQAPSTMVARDTLSDELSASLDFHLAEAAQEAALQEQRLLVEREASMASQQVYEARIAAAGAEQMAQNARGMVAIAAEELTSRQ